MSEEILKLIEEVDPADTDKLDEIDSVFGHHDGTGQEFSMKINKLEIA